jgi:MATE family multidrug resistance protein
MLRLALPVVLADLGWITMGIVDTIMVGRLGPAAIGAVGTGSTVFMALMVLGLGALFALDTFVSQSFGAGRIDECHRWLFAGVQLAVVLAVVLSIGAFGVVAILPHVRLHPAVLVLIVPYMTRLIWSVAPLMVYGVCRRYLQAMNAVRPVMFALVSANLVNWGGNWVLVYGHWGAPVMGVVGSATATVIGRVYLAAFLFAVIWWREHKRPSGLHDVPFAIDLTRVWAVAMLGWPAALQIGLEVGVFATASILAGRITPIALAVNQIVLNIASFTFMVPLGISAAAAVRVGQAVGRRDPQGVRVAGWTALAIGTGLMAVCSCVYAAMPGPLLRIFTHDEAVIRLGATVLFIYAGFQVLDAAQVIATGALRGLGDTRTPMFLSLVGHWAIGLPLGYLLCFNRHWGVAGLWCGLSVSLGLVGIVLVAVWRRKTA